MAFLNTPARALTGVLAFLGLRLAAVSPGDDVQAQRTDGIPNMGRTPAEMARMHAVGRKEGERKQRGSPQGGREKGRRERARGEGEMLEGVREIGESDSERR